MGADIFTHTPAAAELKLPYVARVFTHGFQVFPFVVIRRCDQSAVQQVFATVRLITVSRIYLAHFGLTQKSKRGLASGEAL